MAKAPRRRGRSDGGERPRKARPAKPAKAQPIKPPAAKPVKPPAAKPVKPPAAKPVKPPAAKPVQPAAAKPKAPAPKAPAKPAPKGGGRGARAGEEVVGARGRGGGRGRQPAGSGGMGIGAKVGLLAALVCLVCIAAVVFISSAARKDEDPEALKNAFGYQAASTLAAPGKAYYTGGGDGPGGVSGVEKDFKALFGEEGAELWDTWFQEMTAPIPRELEGTFEGEALEKRQKRFREAEKKLKKQAGDVGGMKPRLAILWQAMDRASRGQWTVTHGWITEGTFDGKWLADSNIKRSQVVYDTAYQDEGSGFGYVDGSISGSPVRIYTAPIRGRAGEKPLMANIALYDRGGKKGGNPIGFVMLILGPLAVGFAAYAVANGHTKNVRTLAREIDRLGTSGDPERQLRATGAEASQIARSVERMVSNLEFREKHDGADLEEVVSKEQKVAEEIHGALASRHPPRLQDYEVETLFKPGFEIGGDHFEYFRIDETHLGIMMLDTNVRGITAALVMASTKAYVRAEAPGELSPAAVLKKVNRHLAGELPAGRHVTGLYVVLNTEDGTAMVASAGHLPLLVYRHQAGKLAKVNPEGIALGLDKGPMFDSSLQEGDIPLGVGDRIVLYTDGALRIQDEEGEEFGEQRFYGAVAQEAPKNSQAFVNFVGAAIDRFHLQVPQNDDITISTVKRLR